MSAAHQKKKAAQALCLKNWEVGKRRKVDGVIYASKKEARMARQAKREAAKLIAA
jgi:hypothetical protein